MSTTASQATLEVGDAQSPTRPDATPFATIDTKQEAEDANRHYPLYYYKVAAQLILLNTSRTAKTGEIDISVTSTDKDNPLSKIVFKDPYYHILAIEKVSKKTIGQLKPTEIEYLKEHNEKARFLDLQNLAKLEPEDIRDLTINNFNACMDYLVDCVKKIKKNPDFLKTFYINIFIQNTAVRVGQGMVDKEHWFRKHDSRKFPYTKVNQNNLSLKFKEFCVQFDSVLQELFALYQTKQKPASSVITEHTTTFSSATASSEKESDFSIIVRTFSAWIEYRINLVDHFMTDSCGKVATLVSTFVCMLFDQPIALFSDKNEYLIAAPKRPEQNSDVDLLVSMKVSEALPASSASSRSTSSSTKTTLSIESLCDMARTNKPFKKWRDFYLDRFYSINVESNYNDVLLPNSTILSNAFNDWMIKGKANNTVSEYYKRKAFDNFMVVSKTSRTGKPEASDTNKQAQIKKSSSLEGIELRSFINAEYDKLIEEFLNDQEPKPFTYQALDECLRKIASCLNAETLGAEASYCRKQKTSFLAHTDVTQIPKAYVIFLKEIVERLTFRDKHNIIETLALIHYRITLQHVFFQDGNSRIALALITYVCIKLKIKLPSFHMLDGREDHYPKIPNAWNVSVELDPQFHLWHAYFKSIFEITPKSLLSKFHSPGLPTSDKGTHNPWGIEIMSDRESSIYAKQINHINDTPDNICIRIDGLRNATGLKANALVVFLPSRIFIHEIIVYVKTKFNVNKDELKYIVNTVKNDLGLRSLVMPLDLQTNETKKKFKDYLNYVVDDYFHTENVAPDLKEKIKYFGKLIRDRIESKKCNINFSESKEIMIKLIADDLLKDFYKRKIRILVENHFLKKKIQYKKYNELVVKPNFQRAAWVIVGGPASGKTSLKTEVNEQINVGEDGCCVVNPDDYKHLLTTDHIKDTDLNFAARVHEESSYVTDQILARLKEMVDQNSAPNILLDIVTSSERKMEIAGKGGATMHLNIASCHVEGATGAVQRSYNRALDQSPQNEDRNRFVPTRVILEGHKEESILLPETIAKFNVNLKLIDTNSNNKLPKLTAVIDGHNKQLRIFEPIAFCAFIRKALINKKAAYEEQAYVKDLSGQDLAGLFITYLEKDIELCLMYGEDIPNPKIQKLKAQYEELLKRKVILDFSNANIIDTKKEDENKKIDEELAKISNKIKQFEKGEIFAVFSKSKGIICKDVVSLQKMFNKLYDDNSKINIIKDLKTKVETITSSAQPAPSLSAHPAPTLTPSSAATPAFQPSSFLMMQEFLCSFLWEIRVSDKILNLFPFYLYDNNGDCILRRDEFTQGKFEFSPSLTAGYQVLHEAALKANQLLEDAKKPRQFNLWLNTHDGVVSHELNHTYVMLSASDRNNLMGLRDDFSLGTPAITSTYPRSMVSTPLGISPTGTPPPSDYYSHLHSFQHHRSNSGGSPTPLGSLAPAKPPNTGASTASTSTSASSAAAANAANPFNNK